MKHTIKKIKFILYFCLAIFLLYSCEKDLYEDEIKESRRDIKISTVSMKELYNSKVNLRLTSVIDKVSKRKKLNIKDNNKIVYDSVLNFYFDDDYGKLIESGDYKSFTFKINRVDSVDSKIENIVFSLKDNGDYETYLVKYGFTKEELNTLSEQQLSIKENTITKIDLLSQSSYLNRTCYEWVYVEDPRFFRSTMVLVPTPCPDEEQEDSSGGGIGYGTGDGSGYGGNTSSGYGSDGSSSGTSGDGSSGSGGNETGGSSTTSTPNNDNGQTTSNEEFMTTPVDEIDEAEALLIKKPCERLSDMANSSLQDIKPWVDIIKQKEINHTVNEWSVCFKKSGPTSSLAQPTDFTYDNILGEGTPGDSPFFYGDFNVGSVHCHTSKGVGLFSFADLMCISKAYEAVNNNLRNDVTMLLVSIEPPSIVPNVYAIKVDNFILLKNKLNEFLANSKYAAPTEKEKIDNIHDDLGVRWKGISFEKSFLQTFGSFGISLYKATNDDLTSWGKLKLDASAPNGVDNQPCLFQ